MKSRCTAAFLSFVTAGNKDIRQDLFDYCFLTFEKLQKENDWIRLIAIDNSSINSVRDRIASSASIDAHYLLDKNMFDTALFCAGLDASDFFKSEYILFTYDDFDIYKPQALLDTISFMDQSGVDCTRVTAYSVKESHLFNSEITPKSKNPDSIRHTNTASGQKISHSFFGKVGESDFFLTNWHYTSRPCVWRTAKLREIISEMKDLKILQGFEGAMVRACHKSGVSFATLDGGMMKTFPVQLSARTSQDFTKSIDEVNHTVSQSEMNETLTRCRVIKESKSA